VTSQGSTLGRLTRTILWAALAYPDLLAEQKPEKLESRCLLSQTNGAGC
jgi:hypothetical protein